MYPQMAKMIKVTFFFVIALSLAADAKADQRRYDGHKVFRIIPSKEDQVNFLRQFLDAPNDHFDFWVEPSSAGHPVDLRVSAESVPMFSGLMKAANIPFNAMIDDVQHQIDRVQSTTVYTPRASIVGTYASHNATNDFMVSLCNQYPTLATCGDVGLSYEKRTIKYIKLGANQGTSKPRIFVDATMHAREWLSTATAVYIINLLVTKYNTDSTVKRMMDTYDWFFIPICNPDGYEYTRNKDRLWRKTRSQNSACFGADPNRNFDFMWASGGASSSPCSDTYHGSKPFSEPETKAISDFMIANKGKAHAYYSLHTYSQLWLLPYGKNPRPTTYDELLRVAKIGIDAIQKANKSSEYGNLALWKAGTTVDLLYVVTGSSTDWALGTGLFSYSYCLELRPPNANINGFVVSENQIEPSGLEIWAGLVAATDAIPLTPN